MHAKNAELFIGFLGEHCGIPLRTLRENFIPRKNRNSLHSTSWRALRNFFVPPPSLIISCVTFATRL
jgi:hypothetical protein